MSVFDIKLGTFHQLPEIMNIIKYCIKDMESQGIFQWGEYYPTKDEFECDINSRTLYSTMVDNSLEGIITLSEFQYPEYQNIDWSDQHGKNLVIYRLAVHPQNQNQGIARKIMDFAELYAVNKGYTSIRLDAYSGNKRVLKFYEKRGYKNKGQVFFDKRDLPFYCFEKLLT